MASAVSAHTASSFRHVSWASRSTEAAAISLCQIVIQSRARAVGSWPVSSSSANGGSRQVIEHPSS
jgi:hypothetical protein